MERVIFRVDGGGNIGQGHIMRCLSLAEGLRERGVQCVFVTKDIDPNTGRRITHNGHLIERLPSEIDLEGDLNMTINLIREHQPDLVITDSYEINQHYLEQLKRLDATLMSIDDLAKIHFCSDIVLNQNVGFKDSDYSTEKYTKLLVGPEYVLLRKEVRDKYFLKKEIKEVAESILVTLGGTDPENQTLKVVMAFKGLKNNIEITVVVGPGYQYEEILREKIGADNRFTLARNPQNIFNLMEKTDLAISAGGSTCYELAYLGVPNIILTLADNQKKIAEGLDNYGTSINLGWFEDVTEEDIKEAVEDLIENRERREAMSKRGKELVDGKGVERVMEKICLCLKGVDRTMDEKDKSIILKLKGSLPADITKHIKKCIIYGSRVRGEGDDDSDLDVLMLVDEKRAEIEQRLEDAAYQIMWDHDFRPIISLKIFAEDKFNQALKEGFSFYRNVEREGIVV